MLRKEKIYKRNFSIALTSFCLNLSNLDIIKDYFSITKNKSKKFFNVNSILQLLIRLFSLKHLFVLLQKELFQKVFLS